MEASGYNRYELLCMDEDGGAPAPAQTVTKKKPASAAPSGAPKAATKKANPNSEKENKAAALNKNDAGKKAAASPGGPNRPKQSPPNAAAPVGNANANANANNRNRTRQNGNAEEGQRGAVGFKSPNNEAREQRNNRRNNTRPEGGGFANPSGEYGDRPPRQFRDRDNRGPPRNRFGENGYRGGKREFDRQSGSDKTGVKAVDKRDGAGAHNWGSVKQEIDDINKETSTNDADVAEPTEREETAPMDQSGENANVTPEEEEAKEMTLDEWKAMRQQRAKPQYNLRKAGEGEDTTQWKEMVVLSKKKDGDSEEELEYDPSLYPQRVGRLQRIVDIQFNFNDGRRSGGGGFGRGNFGPGGTRNRGPRPGGNIGTRGGEGNERFGEGGFRGGDSGRGPRPGGNIGTRGGEGNERFGEGGFRGGDSGRGPRPGGNIGTRGGEGNERFGEGGFRGGDSGRPRNERNEGKPRSFGDRRGGSSALKVDDERQFPTLN